jgi:hypothetical protein
VPESFPIEALGLGCSTHVKIMNLSVVLYAYETLYFFSYEQNMAGRFSRINF